MLRAQKLQTGFWRSFLNKQSYLGKIGEAQSTGYDCCMMRKTEDQLMFSLQRKVSPIFWGHCLSDWCVRFIISYKSDWHNSTRIVYTVSFRIYLSFLGSSGYWTSVVGTNTESHARITWSDRSRPSRLPASGPSWAVNGANQSVKLSKILPKERSTPTLF